MLRLVFRRTLGALASALILTAAAYAQPTTLDPHETLQAMGRGINLGNTLEPPLEGAWNNGPAQERYFDDYVAAGFTTVRVPVRWDNHTANTPPYAVSEAWMDRVEQVIDWGLERDLYVILNTHHDDWIKQNYSNPALRARFDSIWVQIANRFQDKPAKLLFEIINEPFGLTTAEVDDLNARILPIIRETNPTRLVIYSGNGYSSAQDLMNAAIPDDPYLMAYFHAYDPWSFAGQGQGTWGTSPQRAAIRRMFQDVADWSDENNMPVMISEFGTVREADFNSRMAFYATYVEEALRQGMAFQSWDDGGWFEVYRRSSRTWNEEKDILLHAYPDGPTLLRATAQDTTITLTWENRLTSAQAIRIERRRPGGTFETVATLPAEATSFTDASLVEGGIPYLYRVVTVAEGDPDRISYPIEIERLPMRVLFKGAAFPVPGVIEAEDFDQGGDGFTYHDDDPLNTPGAYRPGVAVDIAARDDGGFQVVRTATGEWLEYTVDVQEAGTYEITTYVAATEGGGRFRFEAGGVDSRALRVTPTGDDQTLTPMTTTLDLEAGQQILRLSILVARPFNIDRFELTAVQATATEPDVPHTAVAVYPNPVGTTLSVQIDRWGPGQTLELYDALGRRVLRTSLSAMRQDIPLGDLAPGLYVVRLMDQGRVMWQDAILKR
ncbi:MAG: cellulase family glycosylhydrolase [Bacteroidota bacterium]